MPNILSKTNLCRVELLYAHCLKGEYIKVEY